MWFQRIEIVAAVHIQSVTGPQFTLQAKNVRCCVDARGLGVLAANLSVKKPDKPS